MSHRVQQVSALIHRLASKSISTEIEFPEGLLVTVSTVTVGPDLKHATIHVSILPPERTEDALALLDKNKSRIQQFVASELTMKFSPRIHFRADDSQVRVSRIDELIDGIHKDS